MHWERAEWKYTKVLSNGIVKVLKLWMTFSHFPIFIPWLSTLKMAKHTSFFKDKSKTSQRSGKAMIYWSVKSPECCLPACLHAWFRNKAIRRSQGKQAAHARVQRGGCLSQHSKGHLYWGAGCRGGRLCMQGWWKEKWEWAMWFGGLSMDSWPSR